MRQVLDDIERIKDVDATVCILGESGTGKELFARAIHRLSRRSESAFEALNCAAIPENLLESELFGHVRGAFTDAKSDRKGIFEICTNGTLLLDEIGEMPMALQAKLLRVIQEKEITPVGASRSIKVNTRVIAATNRDLQGEVEAGRFREDLFFRLNVIPIYLPALRERSEDIPQLVDVFVKRFAERYNRAVSPVAKDLMLRLCAHGWPGNVRELQNSIERAVVLSKDGQIHLDDVFQKRPPAKGAAEKNDVTSLSYSDAKESFEKSFLLRVLSVAKGSISEAARLSGRYRSDIYRLMEKYGINKDEFKN